jgi:preprotein translocase subunit YajC
MPESTPDDLAQRDLAHSCRNADGDRRIMDPLFLPLLIIVVLALPLILNSRRQKRVMADVQRLQNSLTDGDRVVTTSGLHATVVGSADETTVDLEIAPGVRTTWLRAVIREKITEDDDESAVASASLAPPLDGSARADNS